MEEENNSLSFAIAATPSPNIPLGESLVTNASFANTTLLEVFKYLNYKDLLNCSKVCPLWKQIAFEQSLWNSIIIYSCHKHVEKLFETEYGPNIRNLKLLTIYGRQADTLRIPENVKRLTLSSCEINELQKIKETIVDTSGQIQEIRVDRLYLMHHEFELLGQFENLLTHVNFVSSIIHTVEHEPISDVALMKLTKLQHLGLNATCDESVWENIVKISTLKSLQLTASLEYGPDPSWVAALFGPKFLISNLQSLEKLEIHRMSYIHEYEILQKIKLLTNLKELVLDEICVSKDGESNFGILLGQCQNLERLKISLFIPIPDIPDVEQILHVSALENSEIVKGVLSLKKKLKYFRWYLVYDDALHYISIYSGNIKNAIPFYSFKVITKNQVRTYVATIGPGYITMKKLSKIFEKMLPNTKVEILTPDDEVNKYMDQHCFECYKSEKT